jgi:hypothetical protein
MSEVQVRHQFSEEHAASIFRSADYQAAERADIWLEKSMMQFLWTRVHTLFAIHLSHWQRSNHAKDSLA